MAAIDKFDLIVSALPKGYDFRNLRVLCEDSLWQKEPERAAAIALRKCPDIDWDSYIRNNPDVQAAAVHPFVHFLKHGIFEGRKLYVRNGHALAYKLNDAPSRPKVSIIIPNHNQGEMLEYGLKTLRNQSLADIEIIVVDDASSDESMSMLQQTVREDRRIKVLSFRKQHGTHMARAAGVEAATGQYIMFMDADDFFRIDACEMAYDAISSGYDVASFNVSLVETKYLQDDQKFNLLNYINRGEARSYSGDEAFELAYVHDAYSDLLWNKIYEAELCKAAFNEMSKGFYINNEDIYETLVILSRAHKIKKISDQLYIYRPPVNHLSHFKNELTHNMSSDCIWTLVNAFLEKSGNTKCRKMLENRFMGQATKAILKSLDSQEITTGFNYIANVFGITEYAAFLISAYLKQWSVVANVFRHYAIGPTSGCRASKRIGILYPTFAFGGAEKVILELCTQLEKRGHPVTLFLERPHQNDKYLPDFIEVVYVPLDWYNEDQAVRHIYSLANALEQHPVDMMLCAACWDQALLWQTILLKLKGIPVIMHNHMAFYDPLLSDDEHYNLKQHNSVLRCADKVICLSRYSEIYNHIMCINAKFVANPVSVKQCDYAAIVHDANRLVIIGQLGNKTKRVTDALRAIGEIVKIRPQIQAIFIGSLNNDWEQNKFYDLVDSLELRANVRVTGWVQDPLPLVANASILISTAYQEAFPLTICQAQALGVPCVMYQLPIEAAANNPAIIQVPHGDYKAIACNVLDLMDSPERLSELRAKAQARMAEYTADNFGEKICKLLDTYATYSDICYPTFAEYEIVLRTIGFYASDPPPWVNE